jgi:hypothetical protein
MSHLYPEGASQNRENQQKPEPKDNCIHCGKEIYQGSSYVNTRQGLVCKDTDCLVETIFELEGVIETAKQHSSRPGNL